MFAIVIWISKNWIILETFISLNNLIQKFIFTKKKLSKKYTKYLNFKFSNKKLNWKYLINPASANLMG